MAKPTNIEIGEHAAQFIDAAVAGGRYGSPAEVVEAALQLFEERESRLAKLRAQFAQAVRSPGGRHR